MRTAFSKLVISVLRKPNIEMIRALRITKTQLSAPIKSQIVSCIHLSLGMQVLLSTRVQNNWGKVIKPLLSLRKWIFMQPVLFYSNCALDSQLSMRELRHSKTWEKSTGCPKHLSTVLVPRARSSFRWQSLTLNLDHLHLKSLLLLIFLANRFEVANCKR